MARNFAAAVAYLSAAFGLLVLVLLAFPVVNHNPASCTGGFDIFCDGLRGPVTGYQLLTGAYQTRSGSPGPDLGVGVVILSALWLVGLAGRNGLRASVLRIPIGLAGSISMAYGALFVIYGAGDAIVEGFFGVAAAGLVTSLAHGVARIWHRRTPSAAGVR